MHLKVHINDFVSKRNGEYDFPNAGDSKRSCAPWIKVEPSELVIERGKIAKLRCSLFVPKGIPRGGYYAAVICENIPQKKPESGFIAHIKLASIVKLEVISGGSFVKKAEISEMKVSKEKEGLVCTATLENQCETHIVSKEGKLIVKNTTGRVFSMGSLTTSADTIQPGIIIIGSQSIQTDFNLRDFKAVIKENLPDGNYIAEAKIPYPYEERRITTANLGENKR